MRITRAAIRFHKVGEPDKWQIWIGWRHAVIFKDMYDAGIAYDKSDYQQGFITDEKPMHFVTREEASKIAYEAGQTKELKSTLFSEDLW